MVVAAANALGSWLQITSSSVEHHLASERQKLEENRAVVMRRRRGLAATTPGSPCAGSYIFGLAPVFVFKAPSKCVTGVCVCVCVHARVFGVGIGGGGVKLSPQNKTLHQNKHRDANARHFKMSFAVVTLALGSNARHEAIRSCCSEEYDAPSARK